MIAGVRARATDLSQATLLSDLAKAGIDHVNVLYLSSRAAVHDALAGAGDHDRALAVLARTGELEVCPVAEIGLTGPTLATMEETLPDLAARGATNAGFYAVATALPRGERPEGPVPAEALPQAADAVEESADWSRVRFLWYPPLEFDPSRPLADQVRGGPRCSGDTAVRVEPDGAVYPARGPRRPGGNLLTDDWAAIFRHEVFRNYRRHLASDTHCGACPGLAICAASCPRDPAGWARWSTEG
jgi:radical SAM protein with 4Fe4S-binding SPASM domain